MIDEVETQVVSVSLSNSSDINVNAELGPVHEELLGGDFLALLSFSQLLSEVLDLGDPEK